MVFAGKGTIDQLTDGHSIAYVIQQDNQWDVSCGGLPIYLIGQVGQVQLKILEKRKKVKHFREDYQQEELKRTKLCLLGVTFRV